MSGRVCAWAAVLCVACASEEPSVPAFDASSGEVEVRVGPDGFGVFEGRRLPVDAIVLQLRQRLRTLSAEARRTFVVRILPTDDVRAGATAAAAQQQMNRLVDELYVMGVLQVKYM
jgi:hypothetical protein